MEEKIYRYVLIYMFLFVFGISYSQKKYDRKAETSQLNLEGKTLYGYKTIFDFSGGELRKYWWKYARKFGNPLNMKTYYKVTIPSEITDGNVDLDIFTQTVDGDGGTEFFLGLENEKYKEQVFIMILDFKKNFYINNLLKQIDTKLEKSGSLGREYQNEILQNKKQEILSDIISFESEIEELKEQIVRIERN